MAISTPVITVPTVPIMPIFPPSGNTTNPAPTAKTRLWFKTGSIVCPVPLAPKEVKYGGLEQEWAEEERPGRKSTLVPRATKLRTIEMSILYAYTNPKKTVTHDLNMIQRVALSPYPIAVHYDAHTTGLWRCTSFSITSHERHPDTNAITRATVEIGFTELIYANS